jgi:hypothetical protein
MTRLLLSILLKGKVLGRPLGVLWLWYIGEPLKVPIRTFFKCLLKSLARVTGRTIDGGVGCNFRILSKGVCRFYALPL